MTSSGPNPTNLTHVNQTATRVEPSGVSTLISVAQQEIDLADLPEETKNELKTEMTRKVIENADRQVKIGQDVQSLSASLNTMSTSSTEMAQEGLTMTISNTKDDNLGRTEILIGNSDAAQRGKFSRTQSGGSNLSMSTVLLIGGVIVAATIIAVSVAQ
jgi:hypothetical protein